MDMVTIAEAAELTGRHEKTVRRWIKKVLETDPAAKEKITQEAIADGFSYRIEKDYLFAHSPAQGDNPLDSTPVQSNGYSPARSPILDTGQPGEQSTCHIDPLIAAKDETITLLKEQLRGTQEQLKQKDEQIKTILERAREANILLKGYQDRFLLAAPQEKTVESQVDSTPDRQTRQQQTQTKSPMR